MDSGQWYTPNTGPPQPQQQPVNHPQVGSYQSTGSTNSVHDAQRLLAFYPFASATPTSHVARHLGPLSVTGQPPSFSQPSYYSPSYQQSNNTSSSEFGYFNSPQAPGNDSGYWEDRRDEVVSHLRDQPISTYARYPPAWPDLQFLPTTYHTTPFAQNIFQRTSAYGSYPTPPPGMSTSSSSLANALGTPAQRAAVYQPAQSANFFNTFLAEKSREICNDKPINNPKPTPGNHYFAITRRPTPPESAPRMKPAVRDSPDPLELTPISQESVKSTPRKRKSVDQVQSPSIKRVQMQQNDSTPEHSSTLPDLKIQTPNKVAISRSKAPCRKVVPYVAVPPNPRPMPSTPQLHETKKQKVSPSDLDSEDELGGYGQEDHDWTPRKVSGNKTPGRTLERDGNAPLEKLKSLFDEIFEAEDGLPEGPNAEVTNGIFSPHSTDSSRPCLAPSVIRKLSKLTNASSRPPKRPRHGANGGVPPTPGLRGRMSDISPGVLGRILKVLERSVRAAENLKAFGNLSPAVKRDRELTASPKKKGGRIAKLKIPNGCDGRSKSHTPNEDGSTVAEGESEATSREYEVTDAEADNLERILEIVRDSVMAADCCISLLISDRLPKQLYSEELLTTCLNTAKNQLSDVIYPFVEAANDPNSKVSPLLNYAVRSPPSSHPRLLVNEVAQALAAILPKITALISGEVHALSDTLIIQAVYIAIGPFFVIEGTELDGHVKGRKEVIVNSGTLGKGAMRGLRLEALALIRSIFANHEEQRSWIIEEILTSLLKLSDAKQKAGQFRLRDGRSIRTVSALLLQLVQTSAHDVRVNASRISKLRQQSLAFRRQESFTEKNASEESFIDDRDQEEIQLYMNGLESASKAAKTIILFLTQRSGKGKAVKNSNEAEYRIIFDNLISDLLVVLHWPEWPSAGLLLSIACKYMVSSLDDIKNASQADGNGAKSIALDHLGVIAGRIRLSSVKVRDLDQSDLRLRPIDEILSALDSKALDDHMAVHRDISAFLSKRSSEDQSSESAQELTAAMLGQDLAAALRTIDSRISDDGDSDEHLLSFGEKVKAALRGLWKGPPADVFGSRTEEEVSRIDRFAQSIGGTQSLRNSFHPVLSVILNSLDAPPIFMRTKALRALGQIVVVDHTILTIPNVRRAIESHLLDNSSAVRDAAVELIGKYLIDFPEVAGDYYPRIADRIADTGLAVRKRVIKLLKCFYNVIEEDARRIDISTRLVLRMFDEDDTVKDLAVKTLEELWFHDASQTGNSVSRLYTASQLPADNRSLLMKVAIIMGVSANFKDRQSPLEDVLHKIMVDKSPSEMAVLHSRYTDICTTLIDGLVDASDLPGFTVINCIRTIFLFASAYPTVISDTDATILLPYLKNAATSEEQATSEYLLRIFRVSIPHMPKTAAKFGQELQAALQPMIIKPSTAGGVMALQEIIACICTVVQHLTHDYSRLVALVKSCDGRLQQHIAKPTNDIRALSILIFIVALLCEHCNFDRLRLENESLTPQLNSISQGSIIDHVYNTLLNLYSKYSDTGVKGRILQCLGYLFRAQPSLMTLESSATIMDDIFASAEEEGRGRLLKLMQEFLTSESEKHHSKAKENVTGRPKKGDVNMEELVGNTDGFADSGVSSAVVQRYLAQILDAALSQTAPIQAAAVDVLSFTIKQGLAHPLQSFPVIVALETSPNQNLSNRANALHSILHSKHLSLLNTRFVASARASFDYQKSCSGPVQGYRKQPTPVALLHKWYSLVREKRPTRIDFIKSMVKVFDVPGSLTCSQDDVDFARYMAENFAFFDYKTQEEILMVIKSLTNILSTAGMQIVEALSPSHLLSQLHGSSSHNPPKSSGDPIIEVASAERDPEDVLPIMRCSVVIGIVMLLKAHLKIAYGLSEDKCSKFVFGKKSAVGDKPANRRHEDLLSWQRLPFAVTPLSTSSDAESQKSQFLAIWNEDGVIPEPQEDEFL